MPWEESQEGRAVRHLEIHEFKTGRDRATDKRVLESTVFHRTRSLPDTRGDHSLRSLSGRKVRSKLHGSTRPIGIDCHQLKGRSPVMMPDLIGSHAMQGGETSGRQQIIDRRARGAFATIGKRDPIRRSECFRIEAPLGMRDQAKFCNDLSGRGIRCCVHGPDVARGGSGNKPLPKSSEIIRRLPKAGRIVTLPDAPETGIKERCPFPSRVP